MTIPNAGFPPIKLKSDKRTFYDRRGEASVGTEKVDISQLMKKSKDKFALTDSDDSELLEI